jgi:glycosyltransferase involved in cell wall biosynthesis
MVDRQNEIRFVPLKIRHEISPMSDLRSVAQLLRLIRLEGPFDIVHGHSSKGGAIARIAGRLAGIPTVYTPHGLIVHYPRTSREKAIIYASIERILGHTATSRVVAVSEGERKLFLKLKLVPKERIVVIQNAIGEELFEYFSETTRQQDLSQKPLTFGSLMILRDVKGPGHLVEAFIRVSNALPQVPMRLVIAGDGELFDKVRKQVKASGLDEKISLLGWRVDIKNVLREFDVFVLSSFSEGFPYSILEAMAAKLPIVSTNVSGTKETVSEVPGNILVPVGDPNALAHGMHRMATMGGPGSVRRSLQKIGQANQDYVRIHFRQSENTRRNLRVYEELLSLNKKL